MAVMCMLNLHIKTGSKKGLGGANTAVRNEMQKYGKHLSDLWKPQNMEDTSAKGKHAWATTRSIYGDRNVKI